MLFSGTFFHLEKVALKFVTKILPTGRFQRCKAEGCTWDGGAYPINKISGAAVVAQWSRIYIIMERSWVQITLGPGLFPLLSSQLCIPKQVPRRGTPLILIKMDGELSSLGLIGSVFAQNNSFREHFLNGQNF